MARPPVFPAEEKVRIVLSILAGECPGHRAGPPRRRAGEAAHRRPGVRQPRSGGLPAIAHHLQFLNVDEPPKAILVSSALPAEGKTTLVVNLALALADAGRRVTVVEADLRRPEVTRYLGLVSGAGLTSVLAGNADIEDVVQTYRDGLYVIAAGLLPPNLGELLASDHMASLVDKLRGTNDFVLIDAPPLLPVADASGLAVHTDGALLSVRYGTTHKEHFEQAAATLERVGAKTLGVVLNIVPPTAQMATAYGYGYGYRYGYRYGSEAPRPAQA
jgi:capsular exopolysaccharide synthesis family protein